MRRSLRHRLRVIMATLGLLLFAQSVSAMKLECWQNNVTTKDGLTCGWRTVWSGVNGQLLYHHQPAKLRSPASDGLAGPAKGLPMGVAASDAGASGVTLSGELRGDWDYVTGWLSFPYEVDGVHLEVLLRGFDTTETRYGVHSLGQWNGKLFWIDLGDGLPRLLPAQVWDANYVPAVDELPAQAGRLYFAGYVLFRQAGKEYAAEEWESGAAWADLWFVMDANDEQVLEISIDPYDDAGNYLESHHLAAGDQLQIFTNAYDLTDPDYVTLIDYMDPKLLTAEPTISLAYWQPNIDFTDPDLAAKAMPGFDTSGVDLELLLEGVWEDENGDTYYGYSNPPTALGYTWGEAKQIALGVSAAGGTSSGGGGGALLWLLLPLGVGLRLRRYG